MIGRSKRNKKGLDNWMKEEGWKVGKKKEWKGKKRGRRRLERKNKGKKELASQEEKERQEKLIANIFMYTSSIQTTGARNEINKKE